MTTTDQTLGELVTQTPGAAKVLHRHRLDYCCGGKQSLAQACAAEGLDPDAVLREIELTVAATTSGRDSMRWDQQPIAELVGHIIDRYHAPLRTEIPRLIDLARQVERAHADKPERPRGLANLLVDIRRAVESHLGKEEQILFPLILSGRGQLAHMPVQVMLHEHEDHRQNLRRIRQLTDELRIPEHACASWRELYESLGRFERELMDHIHLENNVLFPRALAG